MILTSRFREIVSGLDEKYSPNAFDEKASFAYYTYKFAFLLSKKKHNKILQPLENNFVNEYFMNRTLKEDQIKEFFNNNTTISILNELKSDISEELFKSFNNHII